MEAVKSNKSLWISLGSGILAILIFLFILFVTYLPNQPESVDASLKAEQIKQAEAIRAEGNSVLNELKVLDAERGRYRIPINRAMELTLSDYQK